MAETEQLLRETGIEVLGNVLWGTHFCLFYRTKEDLIDILVPYFKAGLENNEFCMWIASEPLTAEDALGAMKKAVPDFPNYLKKGQIDILPYDKWYLEEGSFNQQRVLKKWNDKLTRAVTDGYVGMRVTGNTTWVSKRLWNSFVGYEHQINETIDRYRMIVVCTYCIDKCALSEIIEVVNNHQLALIGRAGRWELIKNAERIRAEKRAREYQTHLKTLASELSLTEERERHRIAAEMNATIGQSLVISKMKLDKLRASTPYDDIAGTLGEVCGLLGQTIQETRTLTFDLCSPILYELGFEKAVAEWLSEQIENKHGIKSEFQDDGQEKPLDEEMRVFLFCDVRELLFNVIRHAQAKKVKVSMQKVKNLIKVIVEDDGLGFNPDKVMMKAVRTGAFGLFSIRQRLELLGGHLEIESAPGQGTKVTIIAPLKRIKTAKEKW